MAQVTVRTTDGGEAGALELSDHVYGRVPHRAALYAAVQQQMANARQGTHATKNRKMVSGGGKKPWRQKGTGRARQGSVRAPQWRGGGTVHGPVPHSYRQSLPREVRRLAMRSALSDKLAEGKLIILESLIFEAPRTKGFLTLLEALGITGTVLFVTDNLDRNAFLSGRNLQSVDMLPAMGVDVLSVLKHDWLVLTRSAATHLEATLA
ncbi:MAG: 50S ribosomal protein L4 [Chloroflexota bacterium]